MELAEVLINLHGRPLALRDLNVSLSPENRLQGEPFMILLDQILFIVFT